MFIFIFLISILIVNAAQIPAINSYATDNSGILSASAKSNLENDLRDLEKSTNGVQYVVYIENEFPKEYSLEEYTLKIAEANKIGKKGNDNGILLYVAIKDKKYRWELGYGVESTLSSALLGRISREYLVANFRNNDYEQGILQAVDVTKRILLGSNDADIVALKNEENNKSRDTYTYFILGFIMVLMLMGIITAIKDSRKQANGRKHNDSFYHGAAWGLFAGGFGRGGFGGGSSGGGFGGFSGGGGGFGGGGFSGKF